MTLITSHTLEIFADYHQFWVADEQVVANPNIDRPNITEQSLADMLSVSPQWLIVTTLRPMSVLVTIEVHNSAPDDSFKWWDHVTQAGIEITSGRLAIGFHETEYVNLAPGTYFVRIYYGDLDSLDEMGLEGDDHYRVVFWPGALLTPRVLKRWQTKHTYDSKTYNDCVVSV